MIPGPEPGPLLTSLVPGPDAIEPLSLSRIEAVAGELPWSGDDLRVAMRVAYSVGDASVLSDFDCSPGAVEAGVQALLAGALVLTDVRMVLTGIDRRRAEQLGVTVRTLIDAPDIADLARSRGITRSAQAVLSASETLNGAVIVIGNAPTALLALLDMVDAGLVRPAVVLGFPVGYVAAAESKAELQQRAIPYITMRGPRGGTPMAVAATNTLLRIATERAPEPVQQQAATSDRRIHVIGVGDGGLTSLGVRARRLIDEATTIYGGTRHLAMLQPNSARTVNLSSAYADALAELTTGDVKPGTVVLASGDPMLFGIGSTLARHLGAAAAERLDVISHPSSVQVTLSRLGLPAHDLPVLSVLARPLRPMLAATMGLERFAVLLDPEHSAPIVAQALLDAGMEDAEAIVAERVDGPNERITRTVLSDVAHGTYDPLSLLLVLRDAAEVSGYRRSAIPEDEFEHRGGLITKAEVRVLAVAALQLRPSDTLWDIGAGSGSVGIEAALSLPGGMVCAVDRADDQVAFIEVNRKRFRTPQVEAIAGQAPEVLEQLPDPDAVFIGGGGADLSAILDAAIRRVRAGGRVVVTLATVERVGLVLAALRAWGPELREVSIARGVPLADGTRLDPANPVFLISATKPLEG